MHNIYKKNILGYVTVGIEMVLSVVIGYLIGSYLDNHLKSSPVFLIIFVLAGIVSAFKRVYVISKKYLKETGEDKE